MATIGQALTAPEAGWVRIDEKDNSIAYSSGITKNYAWSTAWNGAYAYWQNTAQTITFTFIGKKFRIGGRSHSTYSTDIKVNIDGVDVGVYKQYHNNLDITQCLFYESSELSTGKHTIVLSSTYGVIDWIDIIPLNKKLILKNPTTNQHYSLADKTLIPLSDGSDETIIEHGIKTGTKIQLDVDFNRMKYSVENVEANKNSDGLFVKDLVGKPLKIKFE